jgi:hypothetical protein
VFSAEMVGMGAAASLETGSARVEAYLGNGAVVDARIVGLIDIVRGEYDPVRIRATDDDWTIEARQGLRLLASLAVETMCCLDMLISSEYSVCVTYKMDKRRLFLVDRVNMISPCLHTTCSSPRKKRNADLPELCL